MPNLLLPIDFGVFQELALALPEGQKRKLITTLEQDLATSSLSQSAELYAEVYQEDEETQEWTAAAIQNWPADE